MTIKSIVCEPSNSILFILDSAGGETPQYVPGALVVGTEAAVLVGCQEPGEGATRIVVGPDAEIDPGRMPVHDQMLATPKRLVRIETVEGEVIVEHPVGSDKTRVRIWANHDLLPDEILIGLS